MVVPDDVLEQWNSRAGSSRRYWLHTEEVERTHQQVPMSTDLSRNGNALPDLVDGALRVLDHQRIRTAPIRDAIETLAHRDSKTARAQKVNLELALETIERQIIEAEDGVARLQNAYEMTFAGPSSSKMAVLRALWALSRRVRTLISSTRTTT